MCPVNTKLRANGDLVSAHSQRHWPNIKPLLFKLLLFAGRLYDTQGHTAPANLMLFQSRLNVGAVSMRYLKIDTTQIRCPMLP